MRNAFATYRRSAGAAILIIIGFLATLGVVLVLLPMTVAAQPVQKYVSVTAPARTVATDLSPLFDEGRPRVGLFRSGQTAQYIGGNEKLVEDAVYFWELLLLGLRIPYESIDDRDVDRRIDRDYEILIMPVAEALSDRQKRRLREYVEDGGNIIASGRFGAFDQEGNRSDGSFFRSITGAEYIEGIPAQPYGYLQSLTGKGPVSAGVDPGYQLNIAAQQPLAVARPVEGLGLGRLVTYAPSDQAAFDSLTTAVYNEKGDGHVLWTRFHGHEVSREDMQQYMWQRLVVNSMVDMVDGISVSVAPWPNALPAALSVVALPTVGYDPIAFLGGTTQLLDLLDTARIPASFYLTSTELSSLNDLRNRLITMGEVGITAESDRVLKGQPMEIQRDRILQAKRDLGIETFHGIYPPGGFFDGNTIRVMDDLAVDYLLLPGLNSWAPGELDWWKYVDYRERLNQEEIPEEPQLELFVPGQSAASAQTTSAPAAKQLPDAVATVSIIEGIASSYEDSYTLVRDVNGHYVLPYYPETYSARSAGAADLERTLALARQDQTWIATVSDVLIWWRQRQSIRPVILSIGRQEMHVEVNNDSESIVAGGATLEVKMGDRKVKNMRVAGGEGMVRMSDDGKYAYVHLPQLDLGPRRFVLTWDR